MNAISKLYLWVGYAITFFVFISHFISQDLYRSLVKEDGLVEYGTAITLLVLSVFLLFRTINYRKKMPLYWSLFQLLLAALFFFGFGEEISWGQRLFNIESSDFFLENNAQKETNLHNLVVNDTKINKIIFAQGFTIVMSIYFLFSQFLYSKVGWVKSIVDKLSIPIPKNIQILVFLIVTGIVIAMGTRRVWEIWELAFTLTILWIFLSPKNKYIYEL